MIGFREKKSEIIFENLLKGVDATLKYTIKRQFEDNLDEMVADVKTLFHSASKRTIDDAVGELVTRKYYTVDNAELALLEAFKRGNIIIDDLYIIDDDNSAIDLDVLVQYPSEKVGSMEIFFDPTDVDTTIAIIKDKDTIRVRAVRSGNVEDDRYVPSVALAKEAVVCFLDDGRIKKSAEALGNYDFDTHENIWDVDSREDGDYLVRNPEVGEFNEELYLQKESDERYEFSNGDNSIMVGDGYAVIMMDDLPVQEIEVDYADWESCFNNIDQDLLNAGLNKLNGLDKAKIIAEVIYNDFRKTKGE